MSANNEKVFHFYEDMLPEVREVVVGEMQPEDRCRFTRCSKLSRKEAKSSKNYIHSLTFHTAWKYVSISILYEGGSQEDRKGFSLSFHEWERKIIKRCTSERGIMDTEIWKEEMNKCIDIYLYGAELFKDLLKEYQNTIKELRIFGLGFSGRLKNYDYEIRSLKKLESLRICGSMDVLHYLSKLKRPLKNINVDGASCLVDREELYQITNSVSLSSKLTYEQMCRLAAPSFTIPFGDITEIQICNFIQSWQNGTLGKEVGRCCWYKGGYHTFNIPKLFRLLGLDGDFTPAPEFDFNEKRFLYPREIRFEIDHNHNAMLKGILWCNHFFEHLKFEVGYVEQ